MRAIPSNSDTVPVVKRLIWFEAPEKSLSDPVRLMAYAMAHATHEEMKVLRRYVSDIEFCEALDHAPPGIIDPRSWAYWNSKMGRYPAPPMPVRRFGDMVGPLHMPFRAESKSIAPSGVMEDERRQGREAWKRMSSDATTDNLEEIRRKAREEWLANYGPKRG